MDYSQLNIFNKDKFILRSETRQKQFPFIKYNGRNFEEVVAFLSTEAPNLVIEPHHLKVGEIYSISGRDKSLLRIPYDELRFVIASNPFLVSEDDLIPLTLDYLQAQEFLKENRHHKLFAFENPLATYKYTPEHSAFMMYDYSHPNGQTLNSLHKKYDWYVCSDDGANRKWYGQKVEIDNVLHTVRLNFDCGSLVYRIERIVSAINKNLALRGQLALFDNSWEHHEWRKILKKKCHNENHFQSFVNTLYLIVCDKDTNDRINSLGNFEDNTFVKIIDGLCEHYVYGRESKYFPISQIFIKYLNHNQGPQEPSDYFRLQEGILKDLYDYLITILKSVKKVSTVDGKICIDEDGNVFCWKVLLSQDYSIYQGCECRITDYIKNADEQTQSMYPYSCDRISSITLNRTGLISKDEEGTLYCDRYVFRDSAKDQISKEILIQRIRPFAKPRGQYLGEVIEHILAEEMPDITHLPISHKPGEKGSKRKNETKGDSKGWTYSLPDDIFTEEGKVAIEHTYISGLKGKLKSKEVFSPLFNYILILGGIISDEEAGALLRAFTGHPIDNANDKATWGTDYRILYYLVKYMFTPKAKFSKMIKCIDIHYPSDDERRIAENSPSSYAERISGDNAPNIIETLYRLSDVFPKPQKPLTD